MRLGRPLGPRHLALVLGLVLILTGIVQTPTFAATVTDTEPQITDIEQDFRGTDQIFITGDVSGDGTIETRVYRYDGTTPDPDNDRLTNDGQSVSGQAPVYYTIDPVVEDRDKNMTGGETYHWYIWLRDGDGDVTIETGSSTPSEYVLSQLRQGEDTGIQDPLEDPPENTGSWGQEQMPPVLLIGLGVVGVLTWVGRSLTIEEPEEIWIT